jgi:hypothetical protein
MSAEEYSEEFGVKVQKWKRELILSTDGLNKKECIKAFSVSYLWFLHCQQTADLKHVRCGVMLWKEEIKWKQENFEYFINSESY